MVSGAPDWFPRLITSASNDEQIKISVSDSDSSGSFSNVMQSVLFYNDGPNPVHYKRNAEAATTNFKLPAKAWLMIDVPVTTPHFICANGQSATVYCYGVY